MATLSKNFVRYLYQPPATRVWHPPVTTTTAVQVTSVTTTLYSSHTKVQTGVDANGFPTYKFIFTPPNSTFPVAVAGTFSFASSTNSAPVLKTVQTTTPGYWETVVPAPFYKTVPLLGWNSSASSIPAFNGDGETSFTISASSAGVVAGLNNLGGEFGSSYTNINYAILAESGIFRVIENGVPKTSPIVFSSTTVFTLRKLGTNVYYLVDGVQYYKSATPSTDAAMVLDASLYASGDKILTASVTDLPESIFASGTTNGAGRIVLSSYQIGNVVHVVNQSVSGAGSVVEAGYSEKYTGALAVSGEGSLKLSSYKNGSTVHVLQQAVSGIGTIEYANIDYASGQGTLSKLKGFGSDRTVDSKGYGVLPKLTSQGIADGIQINSAVGSGFLPALQTVGYSVSGGAVVPPAIQVMKPVAGFGSDKRIDSKGFGALPRLSGYGLQWEELTNYLDETITLGTFDAYGYQQLSEGLNEEVSFGTLVAYGGGVLEETVSFGTLTAVAYNTNVAVLDEVVTLGTMSAYAVVGILANANETVTFGTFEAFGGGVLAETLSLGTLEATAIVGTVANLNETVYLGTIEASGYVPITANLNETVRFGDFFTGGLNEIVYFGTITARGGFTEDTSIAYCINTTTGALTRFTNFGFKRIVRINNKYYGLKADGLYLLEGATDNGTTIDARARTGMFHANDYHIKRIQYAYLRENHFATNVGVTADDNEFYPTYTYLSAFNGKRVKFAMGVSGIYWDFEFSNVSGGGLNIGAVEFRADITSRKV